MEDCIPTPSELRAPIAEHPQVLIIGAGPTGLTLALELALQKTPFRIIDELCCPSDKSRALIVQPRTLELLNRHGNVAKDIVAAGTVGVGGRIYVNRKEAASFTVDDIGFNDTAFNAPVWLSQADTERILDEQLRSYGHHGVERGMKAEKVEQDEDEVTVTILRRNGEREEIKVEYAVGCDGAHSVVRHAAGLSFEGDKYPQHFILADVRVKGDYLRDHINFFLGKRVMVMFPMKGGYVRLIGQRKPSPSFDIDAEPTFEEFQEFLAEMAPPGWVMEPDPLWLAHFQFHHRGVGAYRQGRLFVAGDAAHIHSPAGGQGMNTGIQDAINLGWKLAAVLRGEGGDSLRDSYSIERKRVGDHLLHGTDRMFRVASSMNPLFTAIRNFILPKILPWVLSDKSRRARGLRFISQLGIRYRRSPVVGTAEGFGHHGVHIRGGDRAPDGVVTKDGEEKHLLELCSSSEHTLLLFSGTDTTGLKDEKCEDLEHGVKGIKGFQDTKIVRVEMKDTGKGWVDHDAALQARYGMRSAGYALIRPDHYLAYVGTIAASGELLRVLPY